MAKVFPAETHEVKARTWLYTTLDTIYSLWILRRCDIRSGHLEFHNVELQEQFREHLSTSGLRRFRNMCLISIMAYLMIALIMFTWTITGSVYIEIAMYFACVLCIAVLWAVSYNERVRRRHLSTLAVVQLLLLLLASPICAMILRYTMLGKVDDFQSETLVFHLIFSVPMIILPISNILVSVACTLGALTLHGLIGLVALTRSGDSTLPLLLVLEAFLFTYLGGVAATYVSRMESMYVFFQARAQGSTGSPFKSVDDKKQSQDRYEKHVALPRFMAFLVCYVVNLILKWSLLPSHRSIIAVIIAVSAVSFVIAYIFQYVHLTSFGQLLRHAYVFAAGSIWLYDLYLSNVLEDWNTSSSSFATLLLAASTIFGLGTKLVLPCIPFVMAAVIYRGQPIYWTFAVLVTIACSVAVSHYVSQVRREFFHYAAIADPEYAS